MCPGGTGTLDHFGTGLCQYLTNFDSYQFGTLLCGMFHFNTELVACLPSFLVYFLAFSWSYWARYYEILNADLQHIK